MKKYHGLCIGGPLDGQRKAMEEPSFKVEIPPTNPLRPDYSSPPGPIHFGIETVVYRWYVLDADGERYGFWLSKLVLRDPTSQIMASLIAGYRRAP